MNIEKERLKDPLWKKWGPYLSDRQWGTVREDYSANGDAWGYTTHQTAKSKAWRWGEDGLAGISDSRQLLCFSLALWNTKDPFLKERLFGLSGPEGNHGEDVKELYYYLDATPTHSYQKMLYKYPQQEFPYQLLSEENQKRTRTDPEFELVDTGIFNENKYFDVFIEYAKADTEDILIKITIHNRSSTIAPLQVLPTCWFRNNWNWGLNEKPSLSKLSEQSVKVNHKTLDYTIYCQEGAALLFCDNETNCRKLYSADDGNSFYKDGINDYVIDPANNQHSINPAQTGTKAAFHYILNVEPARPVSIKLRLTNKTFSDPFSDFESVLNQRLKEADAFYQELQQKITSDDLKMLQRQAFAGLLWSKQFYYYNVEKWLTGDPKNLPPPAERLNGRNHKWRHLNNSDIISMPDKWEYPWYAAWDLGFHCICFAEIDPAFAKQQLTMLTHEWYMHPNGQLPAYEWEFSDVNPPVHALATWKVYETDKEQNGGVGDIQFLETVFHKLIMNFTWWVNRKDEEGNNIFEGGFLGMDNIGLFDRNTKLPNGARLEQSDGTSWMATYSLNLMRIALELAKTNPVYQDMGTKFFEHFLYIAHAMASMGENNGGLWDDEDEFFYDVLKAENGSTVKMKIRSLVGLIPLLAVEVLDDELLGSQKDFAGRLRWFLLNRPEMANLVSRWGEKGKDEKHLLSLLRGHRMKRILSRMLDETEFLSDHGIRALSKYHKDHPFEMELGGNNFSIHYTPGESDTDLFGGNSNWRGPVWMPLNYLIIESLHRFHDYYGDDFKVEYPTQSGNYFSLMEIADKLSERLMTIFMPDKTGQRAFFGENTLFQTDPDFKNYLLFNEYFHGDSGKGLGASHQTGWTALIVRLISRGNQ